MEVDQSNVVDTKVMKIAFFIEGTKIAEQIQSLNDTLVKEIFYKVMLVVLLLTILFVIIASLRATNLATRMTAQIIHLYETLYEIASDQNRHGCVELSFKQTSQELNELHLTFNRVARTMNLASLSMQDKGREDE